MVIDWILTLLQYMALLVLGFVATLLTAIIVIFIAIMIKSVVDYIRGGK